MELPYNIEDKYSIIEYAKRLKGRTLRLSCEKEIESHNYSGKGNYGQLLEKYYFLYNPNSDSEPDFPIAGIELKSTPLKKLKKQKKTEYRSKERLVLNIINYLEIVNQNFDSSSFWKKNACILLVCYLHKSEDNLLDYIIKIVDEWTFPNEDLEVIKKDWVLIKNKIAEGRAHELSEGDTFYLGACTKGANAKSVREQPYSDILAKQRAFSLKQGYVNHIIASIASDNSAIYGKLIPSLAIAKKKTIEEIVIEKFEPYYDKPVCEILNLLGIKLNPSAKAFCYNLTKALFGISLKSEIEEFEKAEIITKTVRIGKNNLPKESMSFPYFKFQTLYNENWIDSEWKNTLDSRFMIVFFQIEKSSLVLKKVKFWNMPNKDIYEARRVWLKTKEIIQEGNIVKSVTNNKRKTNFPSKKFSSVSHVRPHARDANDTYPLPTADLKTKETSYTKHCFWLNNSYVRDEIYLK